MSNPLAIAAVTATLRNLLSLGITSDPDLAGASVTTLPLDKARTNGGGNQLNLFLYHTMPNTAWRNMDLPGQVHRGETGQPPLALDLYYLLTAYGQDDQGTPAHHVLGRAMSILHDHSILSSDEIAAALLHNDLDKQVEHVRITPQPMTIDEMSKLWTAFQSEYRVSAAYQVSVVLIESTRPTRTPLPVLTIGVGNGGVAVQPDLTPPFPTLTAVRLPHDQPSALLGDILVVRGHHLAGDTFSVSFSSSRLESPIVVAPQPGRTASEFRVKVERNPATDVASWPAGVYTLAALIQRAANHLPPTNALPLSLAPRITSPLPLTVAREADESVTVHLSCAPKVWPEQRASLLLGSREVVTEAHPTQTDVLTFKLTNAPVGEHLVRLRVDGVDSPLVDYSVTPPVFRSDQKVVIT